MFEDALVESSPRRAFVRRGINYGLAYAVEAVVVGTLVLAPLINTLALPRFSFLSPVPLLGSRPPRPVGQRVKASPHLSPDLLHSRITIPPNIPVIHDLVQPSQEPISTGPWIPGIPEGYGGGGGFNPVGASATNVLPPAPPVVHAEPQQRMLRLSRPIVDAKAVYQPKPVYPQLAITSHIQGTVELQAIIGKDGRIQDLKVLSGHPILVRAALEAVKTWRYQPTLLNDEPVDVLTEIDVNFKLGE